MTAYIDPHIHMVSRTTDDYKRMALAGCVMVSEPAFWAGFDRSGVEGFRDYFRQLTEYEPKRAAAYGIEHYCWLCINAKEAENVAAVARGDRDDPRVPRPAGRAGDRRDRPEQEHAQRGDRLPGAPRPGRADQRAGPGPHAAPGGQVPGDADDPRHAAGRRADQPGAGLHRPRRGAHDPRRARGRPLGRHDALPDHQVHARPGPPT